jgi:hypothetical protein
MIENCSWKFQFQCPRSWSGLRETADPNVRLCESCLEKVYLCKNEAEVLRFAAEGKCVAIGFFRDNGMLGKVVEVKQ